MVYTVEVLICTINERIKNIPNILQEEKCNVSYLISWQNTEGKSKDFIPNILQNRKDIKVVSCDKIGISNNRNNALKYATGDFLIIADDDVKYVDCFDKIIINSFLKYPDANILCFQAKSLSNNNYIKAYAQSTFLYEYRPKGTYFSSIEIVLRNNNCLLPRFNELFGLGSYYLSGGEEEIFLEDAFRKKLIIRYIPNILVYITNSITTGKHFIDSKYVRRSKGAVLCYIYGALYAYCACLKYAFTFQQITLKNKIHFCVDMFNGIRYIKKQQK